MSQAWKKTRDRMARQSGADKEVAMWSREWAAEGYGHSQNHNGLVIKGRLRRGEARSKMSGERVINEKLII